MRPFDSLTLAHPSTLLGVTLSLSKGQGRALVLVFCFGVALMGQTPSPPPAPPPSPDAPPMPPPNYSYAPDGRRDPFVNLVNRGSLDPRGGRGQARAEGLAGVAVDELVVRGIVRAPGGGFVAMVGAPNGKTYTVRPGDRLMDGSVRAINAQSVVLMQEVNDPLSLEKQREVRKYLRGEVK